MAKNLQKENLQRGDDQTDIALQAAKDHQALFVESRYPSATTCKTCHPKHYKEWSVSQHAYAQLSPVYLSFSSFTKKLQAVPMATFVSAVILRLAQI